MKYVLMFIIFSSYILFSSNEFYKVHNKTIIKNKENSVIKISTVYRKDIIDNKLLSSVPEESLFDIFPNPAEDYIEISLGSHSVNKGLQPLVQDDIEIYNMLGEVVWKSESVASKTTRRVVSTRRIDISQLPRGAYFVRIGEKTEKFVKM